VKVSVEKMKIPRKFLKFHAHGMEKSKIPRRFELSNNE
jgi:hypothetical protein